MKIELVLGPSAGEMSVHTPHLVRAGGDIYLFYSSCDVSNGRKGRSKGGHFWQYEVRYATSRDAKSWTPARAPVITMDESVCRPWVVSDHEQQAVAGADGRYRMYFVRTVDDPPRYELWTATSSDLRAWEVGPRPVFQRVDGRSHISGPCAVASGGKIRLYFNVAERRTVDDEVFVAESEDGERFEPGPSAKLPAPRGTTAGANRYCPFVFLRGGRWHMLYTAPGPDGGRRTYLSSGADETSFPEGRLALDLSDDARFARGAYKAVVFADHVYFVGADAEERTAIYRVACSELGL